MAAIQQRGNSFLVRIRKKGYKLNRSFKDQETAENWAKKIDEQIESGRLCEVGNAVTNKALRKMYRATKERARDFGLEHTLTDEEFSVMWERSKGRCEISGIVFSDYRPEGSMRRPYFPSIDRIDSSKGYTLENTRLICVIANIAKCDYTDKELLTLASGIVDTYRSKKCNL